MSIGFRAFPLLRVAGLAGAIGLAASSCLARGGELFECSGLECRHAKALLAGSAGERFDPATGLDKRNYAPDRLADHLHMRLEIDIPDMNVPEFTAVERLDFKPISTPLEVLSLNAEQLIIRDVLLLADTQRPLSFAYDGSVLDIRFDPPLPPDEKASIQIEYECRDPAEGLFWTPETDAWPDRPAQIHTQGQPETNRFWFCCHDFPNERLSTELIVTVPEGFLVSSNGRLVSEPVTRGGRTTFHWLQEEEHVNYLVSLIVGKFDVVDVAPPGSRIPMPVYVPPGEADKVEQTYGRTADMLEVFERRFGYPYPWDRYAQLVVWNFGAGGMENTSATTMYDTAILDRKSLQDADLDGLISHELAHQWFGDLITCNTWAHIWLNEGWATYSTALWFEARDGYDEGYLNSMYRSIRGVARRDQMKPGTDHFRPAMVSRVYEHPWEVFRRRANPYPKGSSILHMLRMKLGEQVFFDAVREYVNRYANSTAETDQFRRVLEEVSGLSLEQFFEQWCHRPGTPNVAVDVDWNERDRALNLVITQNQRIDAEHPAFVFDLPVSYEVDGELEETVISVSEKRHEQSIALSSEPDMVLVDPDLTVLMTVDVTQPAHRFVEQLRRGPTLPSRADAARELADEAGSGGAIDALLECLLDESEHYRVRAMAAGSLGDLRAEDALLTADRTGIDDARARIGMIRALGELDSPAATDALAAHASDDEESYACRAEALEQLGRVGDESHLDILVAALDVRSQHDQVRAGGIRGLRELDHPDALGAVIPFTKPGHYSRLRPVAIAAVAELAHHDPDAAFEAIRPIAFDHEVRARRAAAEALVDLEDERGLEVLEQVASTARVRAWREAAEEMRDALAAALARDETAIEQRRQVEELRRELDKLKSQIEKIEER